MFLDKLSKKIWATKNARFEAYRRIRRIRISSFFSLALLSVYIIAINLMVFIPRFSHYSNNVTVITIALSVLTLVLTLLIDQMDYKKKEENFHCCGIELDKLNQMIRLQIDSKIDIELAKEKEYLDKYYSILLEFNLNHSSFDYKYAENKSRNSLTLWLKIQRYVLNIYLLFWMISILLPIISVYLILTW